jgi:SPP1 family predicted phage head-tail adaptor
MKAPTIGDLSHRLRLEAVVRSADEGGGAIEAWSLIAEVWAEVRAVRGYETFVAHGLSGRVTHEVWIRYRDDVGPNLRFIAQGRIFDIRAALDPDGRRTWLRCLCEVHAP